jgi:hypothetical protein
VQDPITQHLHLNQQRSNPGQYLTPPTQAPNPSPNHPAYLLARCARSLGNRTFHLPLDRSGQPRRFSSTRRRVAGIAGFAHGHGSRSAHAASHQRRNHPERTLTQTRSRSAAGRPRCSGSSPTSQTCRCGTTRSARPGRSPAARRVSARATGRPEHFPKQGDLCRRSPSSSRTAGSQYEMLSGLCAARSLTCSRQRETTPPSPTP